MREWWVWYGCMTAQIFASGEDQARREAYRTFRVPLRRQKYVSVLVTPLPWQVYFR